MENLKGTFITFEGGEGCGKTTLVESTYKWLESLDIPVILTKEPGAAAQGEIRKLVLFAKTKFHDLAEIFLFVADRTQHMFETIIPALNEGKIVLCDRFSDSTIAYQGYGKQMDIEKIKNYCIDAQLGINPDRTIWLDLSPEEAFARKEGPDKTDKMEMLGLDFHNRVYGGFKNQYEESQNLPDKRIVRIDASQSKENVASDAKAIVAKAIQDKIIATNRFNKTNYPRASICELDKTIESYNLKYNKLNSLKFYEPPTKKC